MTAATDRSLVRRARSRPPRWRLICVPHAGAGAAAMAGWFAAVPEECELVVVRLPGRESRMAETVPEGGIAELARILAGPVSELTDRPYVLFGYSMGALVAYELTRALGEDGFRLPRMLGVGGHEAPHRPRRHPPLHALPHEQFVVELRRLGGTPEAVFETPELLEMLVPTLRGDFRLVETYAHDGGARVGVPVVTYVGADDAEIDADGVAAWSEATSAPIVHRRFPGGHFFTDASGAPLLPALVADGLAVLAV